MITPAGSNPNVNEAAPSPVGFKNVPSVESPVALKLDGQIPSWVNGVMYRSGIYLNQSFVNHITNTLTKGRADIMFF